MARPRTRKEIRLAVQRAFAELVARSPGLTRKAIAEKLGISQQAVSLYFRGRAVPSPRTLALAVSDLGLELKVYGHVFRESAFPPEAPRTPPSIQLNLSDLAGEPTEISLPGTNLVLRIGSRSTNVLEISVEIDLGTEESEIRSA